MSGCSARSGIASAHAAKHPMSFLNHVADARQYAEASREAFRVGGYVARKPGEPWKVHRFTPRSGTLRGVNQIAPATASTARGHGLGGTSSDAVRTLSQWEGVATRQTRTLSEPVPKERKPQ